MSAADAAVMGADRRGERVLVTGGAGFVGSHVVDLLVARGYQVLVLDNLSTGRPSNLKEGVAFVEQDIADRTTWEIVLRFRPHAVIHLAAQASVPRSVEDPAADARTNIVGGITLAQAAAAAGCEAFVYVNTGGALYGRPRYQPVDEGHPVEPLSPYGLAKWTMENYLRLLLPPTTRLAVLRLANVYGPRQNTDSEAGVVTTFAARMLANEPVTIHGDGEQTRDFVYVADVARACLLALGAPAPLTVNISAREATSVNELYRLVAAEAGYGRWPLHGPERAGDVRHSVLDNRRALAELGWQPEVSLAAGLHATVEWLRDHAESAAPLVVPVAAHVPVPAPVASR
jgi:UDP-glucose 4-epimerase